MKLLSLVDELRGSGELGKPCLNGERKVKKCTCSFPLVVINPSNFTVEACCIKSAVWCCTLSEPAKWPRVYVLSLLVIIQACRSKAARSEPTTIACSCKLQSTNIAAHSYTAESYSSGSIHAGIRLTHCGMSVPFLLWM
jgi:hypothetical protein